MMEAINQIQNSLLNVLNSLFCQVRADAVFHLDIDLVDNPVLMLLRGLIVDIS